MVSRRTLGVISMMMAVLFFLFVFSGVVKETLNDYDTNKYAKESVLTKSDIWKPDKNDTTDVVLIGSKKDSGVYKTVSQWSGYAKLKMSSYTAVNDYKLPVDNPPKLILLDSEGIDFGSALPKINKWVDAGMAIVFCNLPETSVIEDNSDLAQILGIQAVYMESVPIEGVELFGGFLLGGDTIYKVENEEDEKLQDFDMEIPWYQTTSGTKTYIVGLMDKSRVENEYMPGILWRNSIGDAKIFAVNGDYISKTLGIGLLSGIVSECSEYYVYPVVNAQNLTMANFPGFSDENNDEMMKLYSRTQTAVFKDVVWPNILSTVEKNKNKMTCLMSPQYDYDDANEPIASEFVYYLKLINEKSGEAGISTARKGSVSVEEKLYRDRLYFYNQCNEYKFSACYSEKKDIDKTAKMAGSSDAMDLHTITTDFNENISVLSYVGDDVTLQMGTIDGFSHTYQEDLRVKSLQTALGYSNILTDMRRVSWPENESDRFEKLSEDFARYTNTYWQAFENFEQTALSESDRRVRKFLFMDYKTDKKNDTICIDVENVEDTTWFVLRTHGEEISEISGGSYKELETDAYLIQADESHVEVKLAETYNNSYFYLNGNAQENSVVP